MDHQPGILCTEQTMWTPLKDPCIITELSLTITDTDSDNEVVKENQEALPSSTTSKQLSVIKQKYQKTLQPCLFSIKEQTQLKRHIFKKQKGHPKVELMLSMNVKEQDLLTAQFRRCVIKEFNLALIKSDSIYRLYERKRKKADNDIIICSGCGGIFAINYKKRHHLVCLASGLNIMFPLVSLTSTINIVKNNDDFKDLQNISRLHMVGNYIKTDCIILMIEARTFAALKRKKNKVIETRRTTSSRMHLATRLYLCFREICKNQSEIAVPDT